MEEEWKDIPGYEGLYQVSSFGNVRSLNYRRTGKKQILKQRINDKGYYRIDLRKGNNKKQYGAHQLVMMAFENHIPNGVDMVVNHKDNNPLNNHKDNLEIVPQRYNSSCHKIDVGVTELKNGKYQVNIQINYNSIHLGWFTEKDKATVVYNNAVKNVGLFDGDVAKFRKLCDNNAKDPDLIGLKLDNKTNKYHVRIMINYEAVYLGLHEKEKATQVRQVALDNKHLFDGDKTKFRELVLRSL
jgi:hypothetical protein